MADDTAQPAAGLTRGQVAQSISTAVVRLLSEFTGRGPTYVRTTIGDDHVLVLMRDTLLKAERSLVAGGQAETVLGMRRRFQEAMREDLVGVVEGHTGRTVEAFLSANEVEPDVAAEIFVFDDRG